MATETHSDAAAASAPGMPQLDFSTFGNQIFWLLVALAAIYFVLSRMALPRIASVLSERQGTITNDIAAAEDLKAKALQAEAAYDKALADARMEAQRIIAAAKADIQSDLDAAIARADAQIAEKSAESEKAIAGIRESAMENVKIVARDTAKEIVSALGGKPDAKTVNAAVDSRLKG
ncbi:F0F1 ATP synthase subunit B' [Sulfitobacter sabulilitoris]|uniref:ATP synthase subunit b n=1 Tax=Sulfitobacter sabulilitoris TaxID=2562655 RepID=A0A5S3PL65_9RHOB|nr:F0F1 ATP synthase subunit B' [Sulfitobacter sabulilitoris]TMM52956.1 F0F1 ATP synthase subunit B' [Sulfitobacter sabulilitoris]